MALYHNKAKLVYCGKYRTICSRRTFDYRQELVADLVATRDANFCQAQAGIGCIRKEHGPTGPRIRTNLTTTTVSPDFR